MQFSLFFVTKSQKRIAKTVKIGLSRIKFTQNLTQKEKKQCPSRRKIRKHSTT